MTLPYMIIRYDCFVKRQHHNLHCPLLRCYKYLRQPPSTGNTEFFSQLISVSRLNHQLASL